MTKLAPRLLAPDTATALPVGGLGVARVLWIGLRTEAKDPMADQIRVMLSRAGFDVMDDDAAVLDPSRRPDVLLVDVSAVPELADLFDAWPGVPVVALVEADQIDAALKQGAYDIVTTSTLPRLPSALRHAAEAWRMTARIEHLARTDSLSGLANRNAFVEAVEHEVAEGRRRRDSFAVHYLDLDNFKDINDTLGHHAGDALLLAVSERLRRAVRETDMVARLGGDEFAVLQTVMREPADAGTVAAKLLAALAAPFHFDAVERHVGASIGIALNTAGALSAEETIMQADTALYRAKDEGRNRYCFFAPGLDAEVRERVSLAEELRGALSRNEFDIFYQPIISLPKGRIEGIEALVRWNHPRRGVLLPGTFLAAATKAGLTPLIDLWVLERVCRQIGDWRARGVPVVKVAVNIGYAPSSRSRHFVDSVAAILREANVSPALLDFELAETSASDNAGGSFIELDRIQRLGVRLVVDRFGAGPMSLERIGTGGIGRIKIAPRLVAGSVQGGREVALIRAAVNLAHDLGISVVGTGVESDAHVAVLTEAGCSLMQGFHLCPPVSEAEMAVLLREGRVANCGAVGAGEAVAGRVSLAEATPPDAFLRAARLLEEDIARLTEHLPIPLCVVDRVSEAMVFGNEALANLVGARVSEFATLPAFWERVLPRDCATAELQRGVTTLLRGSLLAHAGDTLPSVSLRHADGTLHPMDVMILRSDRYALIGFHDTSTGEVPQDRWHPLEALDEIARFIARRAFFDRAGEAIARADLQNEAISMITFGLDHIQSLYAELDHVVCERVLMALPDAVHGLLRQGDTVGRVGADAFVIVAPGTDCEGARVLAERVRERIASIAMRSRTGQLVHLTSSFGVSTLLSGEASFDNLLVRADTALFAAQRNGGNQVVVSAEQG